MRHRAGLEFDICFLKQRTIRERCFLLWKEDITEEKSLYSSLLDQSRIQGGAGGQGWTQPITLQSHLNNVTPLAFNNRNPSLSISPFWKHLLLIFFSFRKRKETQGKRLSSQAAAAPPPKHPPSPPSTARLINSIHNHPFLLPASASASAGWVSRWGR